MITHRIGFSFMPPIIIAGVAVTLAGLITIMESPILGIGIALAGSFIWSGSYGIQIDVEQNKFREYASMFGIKYGEWKSLEKTPFISVVKGRSGMTVYSRSNRSTSVIDNRFEVCLLNSSHRTRVVIQKFKDKSQAMEYANEIASKLNKSVVQYNPVVSQKTKSRR
jgi:hypothetical protein